MRRQSPRLGLQSETDRADSEFREIAEPGGARDQTQSCRDDDNSHRVCDALSRRREALDSDGCRNDRHRGNIHDADDHEDRDQTSAAFAAMKAEAQTILPGCGGIRGQGAVARGRLPATCEMTQLPARELQSTGDQHDYIDMVQPPGIGISSIADMDVHQRIVMAVLTQKSRAETEKKGQDVGLKPDLR